MVNSLTQVNVSWLRFHSSFAVVVLHNLTNINVSERIHELSTVEAAHEKQSALAVPSCHGRW